MKNDAILPTTEKLIKVVSDSGLSLDEQKKALWRAEGHVITLISGKQPREKKVKAKKSKKAESKTE